MGLPPVVVGLLIYLLLSGAGPLGVLGLLYTPTAMIVAQTVLVMPIVAALTRQVIEDLQGEYDEQLRSLGLGPFATHRDPALDARYSLLTVALAGFGRAIAEVGAVLIVGGNINHVTRVMTTTIALETSKGNLALALALGLILITIAVAVNGAVMAMRQTRARSRLCLSGRWRSRSPRRPDRRRRSCRSRRAGWSSRPAAGRLVDGLDLMLAPGLRNP